MTTLLPNTANTLCATAANRWLQCLEQAREKRLRSVTWVSFGHDDFNKLPQCVMCQYFHIVCAHSRDSGEDCPSRFSSCAWCNHGLQLLETVQCEAGPIGQSVGSWTAGGLRMNEDDCETSHLCCRDVCGSRAWWIIKKNLNHNPSFLSRSPFFLSGLELNLIYCCIKAILPHRQMRYCLNIHSVLTMAGSYWQSDLGKRLFV